MGSRFPTTRWTVIRELQDDGDRRRATQFLVESYWEPLYHYARRSGLGDDDARDVLQDFAMVAHDRAFLNRLEESKGHLRGFLKAAFRHHVSNRERSKRAVKRGGAFAHVDVASAEARLKEHGLDPEGSYELSWATTLMNRAYARLVEDAERQGGERLELLERYFSGETLPAYEEMAPSYGMSVSALKAYLHRQRARFREHLASLVAETTDDVDGEMAALADILNRV